ncbi:hypothetical protein ARMSODRAFT_86856 [Armillaria solidipes]|uniref:Uncharacterized protein n=1 Tax=Armillaria solidipes TaxID=1076256 RepID=A0A2H3C377_9AGAR|nr:hypothetical protein ARMSODRAFT_86856 [Armillaria solidipes]
MFHHAQRRHPWKIFGNSRAARQRHYSCRVSLHSLKVYETQGGSTFSWQLEEIVLKSNVARVLRAVGWRILPFLREQFALDSVKITISRPTTATLLRETLGLRVDAIPTIIVLNRPADGDCGRGCSVLVEKDCRAMCSFSCWRRIHTKYVSFPHPPPWNLCQSPPPTQLPCIL